MYKVVGKKNDMFKVLDLDEGTEELLSAEDLVLALGQADLDGCQHSENGIEVWYDGVDKYEIPIEVWVPVKKFNVRIENGLYRYMISNLGRIKSLEYFDSSGRFHEEHELATRVNKAGYKQISFRARPYWVSATVHSLVGAAFIYNKYSFPQLNHKNENKLDNRAFNLEWCTSQYNTNYGTVNRRRSKALGTPVRQYSVDGKFIGEFDSANAAATSVGVNGHSLILLACAKVHSLAHGFVWRYTTDDDLFVKTESERMNIILNLISDKYTIIKDNVGNLTVKRRVYVVRQYTVDGLFVNEFSSVNAAGIYMSVSRRPIGKVCRRERKTCRGFIWRYAHDDEFAARPENAKTIKEWREAHDVQSC